MITLLLYRVAKFDHYLGDDDISSISTLKFKFMLMKTLLSVLCSNSSSYQKKKKKPS